MNTLTAAEFGDDQGPQLIYVDLDGSLLRSDALFETLAALMRSNPLLVLLVPFWLVRGRAYLKAQLAQRAVFDVALWPYRGDVVEYLRTRAAAGHSIVLATAAAAEVAGRVAR